jgi:PadR family transcriptional regulator, regulatory protein AphA
MTTSTYAVLGLLTLRSWSAYDLAQQAMRSLRFAWPKSESHLYTEPKKLVSLGLAKVRTEPAGQRTRQIYEITPAGRTAFSEWLGTRPQPPVFEAEAMLRLLFADQGGRDDLLQALRTLEQQAREYLDEGLRILTGYEQSDTPFPDRLHLSVLFASFQTDLYRIIEEWARFAQQEVHSWDRTRGLGANVRTRQILATLTEGRSALALARPEATTGRRKAR